MAVKEHSVFSKCIVGLLVVLGLVSLLGIIKTVFVSIDIDESYAISQAYRILKGDRLVADMWEPHQFSAYLTALLLKLHILLVGHADFCVISLRLGGTLIHLLLGYWFYRTIRPWCHARTAVFLTFAHINFLPKWIQTPEFELMHYWLLLITALCLFSYFQKGKGRLLPVLSGICMMLQLLNYPTMILLYPFYILGIFKLKKTASAPQRTAFIITCSAVLPGIGFVAYLLSYQSVSELLRNLNYILADPSHTGQSFWRRIGGFGMELLLDILFLAVTVGCCMCILALFYKAMHKEFPPLKKYGMQAALLAFTCLCLAQMFGCLFLDKNQFFLQERYLLMVLAGVGWYMSGRRKTQEQQLLFWFGMVPALVSTLAAAILTNMSMNVSYSKLFLGVIVTFLLLDASLEECKEQYLYLPLVFLLGSLLVCKLILIRVTGCLPVTVQAHMQPVQNGPLKGIYVLEDLAEATNADDALLKQYVSSEDNLFIFGCESLLYVGCDARIAVASVQGTSVFNQDFLDYLELHPNKYPSVVAVDKRFAQVWEYRYNPWNYIVAEWIENEYEYAQKVETDYMTLYIR